MTVIKRELNSVGVPQKNIVFQQGFDSCRMMPFILEELDLEECSLEELRAFYYSRTDAEAKGGSFKEGVDLFVDTLWEDVSSRRVQFEDSAKIGQLKEL